MLGGGHRPLTGQFSEIRSCLDLLLYYLGLEYRLEPLDHPSSWKVSGAYCGNGQIVGFLGEVHPEVLEHWQAACLSLRWNST